MFLTGILKTLGFERGLPGLCFICYVKLMGGVATVAKIYISVQNPAEMSFFLETESSKIVMEIPSL